MEKWKTAEANYQKAIADDKAKGVDKKRKRPQQARRRHPHLVGAGPQPERCGGLLQRHVRRFQGTQHQGRGLSPGFQQRHAEHQLQAEALPNAHEADGRGMAGGFQRPASAGGGDRPMRRRSGADPAQLRRSRVFHPVHISARRSASDWPMRGMARTPHSSPPMMRRSRNSTPRRKRSSGCARRSGL